MSRQRTNIALDAEVQEELDRLWKSKEVNEKTKKRLLIIRLARGGHLTLEEIADHVGVSRSVVQDWLKRFREGGLEAIVVRPKAPGKASHFHEKDLQAEMIELLRKGKWRTARQGQLWLEQTHGIKIALSTLYGWLGKLGGVLKVPRPFDIKKKPAEAESFKEHFYENLVALNLPPERPVKVWVADESRYGLHAVVRRCWSLKGVRVVVPHQLKYQWGYVYGALEVTTGKSEFLYLPRVSLPNTLEFLQQISESDPQAIHVVIWDRAGFHQRPGDPTLPENIRIMLLPAYSPELNPVEKLWDGFKDLIANRVFATLDAIEQVLDPLWQAYYRDPERVLRLVGQGWMHTQANVL